MREKLKEAKEKGYIVVSYRTKNYEINNEFYSYCKQYRKPYVVITNKNKYCDVQVDLISLPIEFDSKRDKYTQEVKKIVDEAYSMGHLDLKEYRGVGLYTHFTVLKELGEYYAQRILEIVNIL